MSKKTHRQIIEQMQKTARMHRELSRLLNEIENKKFGFSFSDTDDDILIDSLDYGHCSISFEGYLEKMNFYKNKTDENKRN